MLMHALSSGFAETSREIALLCAGRCGVLEAAYFRIGDLRIMTRVDILFCGY